MSTARKVSDVERTCTMLDLLHRRVNARANGGAPSHVVIEEVAPGTGWTARRWADVLVLSVWPSKGQTLDGYEVKASRADLKRELSDLSKHEAVARYCDHWWLVLWDESMLLDGVPESWGLIVTQPDGDDRCLKIIRQAATLTPQPWPRGFVCSLVRNAYQQSPGEGYLARAVSYSADIARDAGERRARDEARKALEALRDIVFAETDSWMRPNDPAKIIAEACRQLGDSQRERA